MLAIVDYAPRARARIVTLRLRELTCREAMLLAIIFAFAIGCR